MRSDTVKKGVQQAPHRSLFNALGMTQEELDRPLIGVVSSYNEIVPGHISKLSSVLVCTFFALSFEERMHSTKLKQA